jgi:NAD(P)-dependent dehydrogenase (short-subunit alcohol dehydrogenase family)
LQDKVAVITGGNSGIGLATARLFRSEGARIAVIGRDLETVRRTVAPGGEDCFGFAGDVSSTQSLNEFYSQVAARFGRIDVLFANAGVSGRLPVEGLKEFSTRSKALSLYSVSVPRLSSTPRSTIRSARPEQRCME